MPQIIFSVLAIERETMNHNNINQIILKTTDSFSIKTIFQDWQAECWYLENGHNCVLRMTDWNSLQNPALAYKGNWNIYAYIHLGRLRNASSV